MSTETGELEIEAFEWLGSGLGAEGSDHHDSQGKRVQKPTRSFVKIVPQGSPIRRAG